MAGTPTVLCAYADQIDDVLVIAVHFHHLHLDDEVLDVRIGVILLQLLHGHNSTVWLRRLRRLLIVVGLVSAGRSGGELKTPVRFELHALYAVVVVAERGDVTGQVVLLEVVDNEVVV